MVWNDGLHLIVKGNPDQVVSDRDIDTKLYPFLLAASVDGKVAINNTYNLLQIKPDLVTIP